MKGCVCEKFLKALAFGILLPTVASVTGLETDHLVESRHVGPKPSFAWRMETPRTGARQAAYRTEEGQSLKAYEEANCACQK